MNLHKCPFSLALLAVLVAGLAGCPGESSVEGMWEISVWNGDCAGDPAYAVTAEFVEGGFGTYGTGVLQWQQDSQEVRFLVGTLPPSVVLEFLGTLVGRNRMEGTHANGTGCWQGRRLLTAT